MTRRGRSDFAAIAAKRERYDPEVEGYGDERQWRGTFYQRMGWEEAERVIREGGRTPRQILGLSLHCTWAEVKSAYRKLAMRCHPDRRMENGMTEKQATVEFQNLQAAYVVLEREFGK
jgi:DnaJ-class molecular chaperone